MRKIDAATKEIRKIYPVGSELDGFIIGRIGVCDPEPTMYLFWDVKSIFDKYNPTKKLYGLSPEMEDAFYAAHGNQFDNLSPEIQAVMNNIYYHAEGAIWEEE